MADKTIEVGNGLKKNMHDLGNGKHAEQVYVDGIPGLGGSGSSASQTQGNVASNATDSGNPVKVGGKFNATPPTLADGQRGDLQLDSGGNVMVNNAKAWNKDVDTVTTYPRGSEYRNITASTLIKTGPGKLTGIWVSAASATPTIKVWDSLTATSTVIVGTFTPTGATMYTFPSVRATIGLYVSISGTVDCTIFYDTSEV